MFKNHDFDPKQILSKRAQNLHPRSSAENLELDQLLPWNAQSLIDDLGLDILFNEMAAGDDFLYETAKTAILSSLTDVDTIIYRQQILKDCVDYEQIVKNIYQLAIDTIKKERELGWGFLSREKPEIKLNNAVNKLELLSEMLKELRDMADRYHQEFHSEGFNNLFDTLKRELNDEYLNRINKHLKELQLNGGILVSANLGYSAKGDNYTLHRPPPADGRHWLIQYFFPKKYPGYTYKLPPRDDAGSRALSNLRNQSINRIASVVDQSKDHVLRFFYALRTELAFYISCLNLKDKLAELDEPICYPDPKSMGERNTSLAGLYDVCLALNSKQKIVGNDLAAEGKDMVVVTGANSGGKSTFMRSLGLVQLMMQAGMFVPAESFSAEICNGIVTHFKREEDTTMESGKLDEELARMNEIVERIRSNALVLFNESFAATNEREGSEIAWQISTALADSGIKVVFVTHLYEFAGSLYGKNQENVLFLRAERLADGTRTFHMLREKPLQTSYGEDLYERIFG